YQKDLGYVQEVRSVKWEKGTNLITFDRLSPEIYGFTAQIRPLGEESVKTLSLAYLYDLASQEKLLKRFIGQWISFTSGDAFYAGRLLRVDDSHLFLQPDTLSPTLQVVEKGGLKEMFYPQLPEDLVLEPTLLWRMNAKQASRDGRVEISYLTSGLSWMCDYDAQLGDKTLTLSAYISIYNDLPLGFPQAQLALVAGKPHQSEDRVVEGGGTSSLAQLPVEEPMKILKVDEYFRYTLPEPVDVLSHQTLIIPLFEGIEIPYERRYIFPHRYGSEEVEVFIRFHLSTPQIVRTLPEGDLSFYDAVSHSPSSRKGEKFPKSVGGRGTFLGQDHLTPTPWGSEVELRLTTAPDIKGQRTRMPTEPHSPPIRMEVYRVKLINGKNEPTRVWVEQRIFGEPVQVEGIADNTRVEPVIDSYERYLFPVDIAPQSERMLMISIRYEK
ncbi:MAG: DUF4139 domain-containing protein, partial [bacterium]